MLPSTIQNFIETFSRLPAIGPRGATRLAFHIITKSQNTLPDLIKTLQMLTKIDECPDCFFIKQKENSKCDICKNTNRDHLTIAIVEKPTDLLTIEKSGGYNGKYLIIGDLKTRGTLEPYHNKRLENLKKRIEEECKGKAKEIIIATNPNIIGDLLYENASKHLSNYTEKITRLGRGIPTGGEIEFADQETLRNALERRM